MTATQFEDDILGSTLDGGCAQDMAKSLDRFRQERFQTIEQFCAELDITAATFYRIVRGQTRTYPSTINKIAKALGVAPGDIREFALPPEEGDDGQER